MGVAAYNRGSKQISRQLDDEYRERVRGKSFDPDENPREWQRQRIDALEREVSKLKNDLSRARRLIQVLTVTRSELRRERAVQSEVARTLKGEYLAKRALAHCYGAIVLAQRLGLHL